MTFKGQASCIEERKGRHNILGGAIIIRCNGMELHDVRSVGIGWGTWSVIYLDKKQDTILRGQYEAGFESNKWSLHSIDYWSLGLSAGLASDDNAWSSCGYPPLSGYKQCTCLEWNFDCPIQYRHLIPADPHKPLTLCQVKYNGSSSDKIYVVFRELRSREFELCSWCISEW